MPKQDHSELQDIATLQQRIQTLEHALDQALLVIQDLRNRLQEQKVLEEQLVDTEEFALIQQKAAQSLRAQLSSLKANLSSQESHSTAQTQTIDQLQEDLILTSMKQEELETQIAHQTRDRARLQQYCQELETSRDQQQARLQELEHQLAELQEQVLHQVQQASEYETAVQHWKHRYQTLRKAVLALSVVQDADPGEDDPNTSNVDLNSALEQLLQMVLAEDPVSSRDADGTELHPNLKVELPTFLTRRTL